VVGVGGNQGGFTSRQKKVKMDFVSKESMQRDLTLFGETYFAEEVKEHPIV